MKKWQWILLAVVAYAVFLLAYTPAIYLTNYMQQSTKSKLSLINVSGTLLSGKADAVAYEGLRLNNVHWQLSPWYLFMLKADLNITGGAIRQLDQIYVKGNVQVSLLDRQNIFVNDASLLLPAKPMLAQVKLPVAVTASGRFKIDITSFNFVQGCKQLTGTGNWLKAAVNINNNELDLGNFDAVLSCESPAYVLQITPDNGIQLDAKINIEANGAFSAKGQFVIPANFPQEIKQGAEFFGIPKGQGVYELNL